MTTTTNAPKFTGFPQEGLDVLAGLANRNTREYFEEHHATYESALLEPAKAFVVALGEVLRMHVSPHLRAEPRVNGSILRIQRDTRFTTDKRPYKQHVDIWFWEGDAPSRERPGLSVRLRPGSVVLTAGIHRLGPAALAAYRDAVDDELLKAIEDATRRRGVSVGGLDYKRVPRGFAPDHPRAELLRHGALYVSGEWKHPRALGGAGFVAWTASRLIEMAPVERWLAEVLPDGA
jgi:uncharacterized protein (TIGR02453 family)